MLMVKLVRPDYSPKLLTYLMGLQFPLVLVARKRTYLFWQLKKFDHHRA